MTKRTHSRRHRSRSRSYKGGSGNYSSASTYGSYVNGSGDSQYNRVFDQSGANAARQSNVLIGEQGQWAQQPSLPTAQNLSLVQSAGKRRRKSKRGGLIGEVVSQAIVPFGILGLQQTYGRKKKHGGKHTRKHRGKKSRKH
jgi:hypothetical protein